MTRALLLHDVGKYVTRIARNLPKEGPIPAALAAMMTKDLYETHRGRRASVRFEELSEALDARARSEARALLATIDGLEDAVRAANEAALREAGAAALALEALLREAAR